MAALTLDNVAFKAALEAFRRAGIDFLCDRDDEQEKYVKAIIETYLASDEIISRLRREHADAILMLHAVSAKLREALIEHTIKIVDDLHENKMRNRDSDAFCYLKACNEIKSMLIELRISNVRND